MVKVMLGIISVTLIWGYTWVAMKVGIHDIPRFCSRLCVCSSGLFLYFSFSSLKEKNFQWEKNISKAISS